MVEGAQVGTYRVIKSIGSGGFGEVWMAEHAVLGRRAAIKLLHKEYSNRPEIVTRFFNEARAATAIEDPGIVQVFDVGCHDDGTAYIVMELLQGETLDARWRRHGTLPIVPALRIIRQVASSLGAAHARGIVHRDLKPENIFLVPDPEVPGGERAKILDFGIAKLGGDTKVRTNTAAIMGTPQFMSPEQCRGAGLVDQRADVYSLGCLLFTVIVGRCPFVAEGPGEVIAMHLREPAPRAASILPSIPAGVDALIARCMEKDPADRFGSGTELASALDALLATLGMGPPHQGTPGIAPRPASTTLSLTAASLTRAKVPDRRGLVVGGAVALVVGAVAIVWIISPGSSTDAGSIDAPSRVAAADAPAPIVTPLEDHTVTAIRDTAGAFARWAAAHPGAPCPTVAEIGRDETVDSWGGRLSITCTDQPGGHIIGIISAGPDRSSGTSDDVMSWTLDREVTTSLLGPRWIESPPPASSKRPVAAKPKPPSRVPVPIPHDAGVTTPKPPEQPTKPLESTDDIPRERP